MFTTSPFEAILLGLMDASWTNQGMVNEALDDSKLSRDYLEHKLVFFHSKEKHSGAIIRVRANASQALFSMKLKKCELGRPKVYILGEILSAHSIINDRYRIKTTNEASILRFKSKVKAF